MVIDIKTDLIPVSMDLLYEGMVVPQDIYDADVKVMLIRRGHTLRLSQIEAIRRYNKGRDIIRVSQETHKLLLQKSKGDKNEYQEKLEKETGYSEIKNDALTMIDKIVHTNVAPHDMIHTISLDLSNRVEQVKPDLLLELINALAPVDEYLQRHCINVSLLNGLIGKWLELPKDTVEMLILIGLVHDCGKANIPPEILNAPRKLTDAEFEIIKMHPVYGYDMLTEFPNEVRLGARGHHEKYTNKGYPDGLNGDKIPYMAQITAVSDIYDAMVSQRAYKTPRSPFKVLSWVNELRTTELDPSVVDIFIKNMPREMLNKSVMLSDGRVGIVHEIDYDDVEYPYIRLGGKVFKSHKDLYCTQMHLDGGA